MIHARRGDLLASGASLLVCPTNTVGVMGAGLARAFAARHPGLLAAYRAACRAGSHTPERPFLWPAADGAVVACLATKRHWRDPSHLADVDRALAALRDLVDDQAAQGRIHTIALPALGCGLGGLRWPGQVAPRVARHLVGAPCEVWVFSPWGFGASRCA